VDDTDSKRGMCTTYVGAVLVERLGALGRFADLPNLVRLNPNIEWKTRGNCAIALRLDLGEEELPKAKSITLETVKELADLDAEGTEPGVAFYVGHEMPPELKEHYKRTVREVVVIEEAELVARAVGAELCKLKTGRGVIGALAAIGAELDGCTYELLSYRVPGNRGTPRRIDPVSVADMDRRTFPRTFDNLDPSTGEIRITPHTPCPVLFGIRARSPEAAVEAHGIVRALEQVERWVVYRTNQATDAHIVAASIRDVEPYKSVAVECVVAETPRTIPGGHVVLRVRDETGEVDCAAYEPTRQFREVVRALEKGDVVRVYGGVKRKPGLPLTVNLEKVEVVRLAPVFRRLNPPCPRCGRSLKSAGRCKGMACKRCGLKLRGARPILEEVPRRVKPGLYDVPPRARRHLSRPSLLDSRTP